jgi:hypothetical protein
MNGYVEAGYLVVFSSLGTYGLTLLGRERAARRRVEAGTVARATPAAANDRATIANTLDNSDGTAPLYGSVPVASGRPATTGDDSGPGAGA